MQEHSGIFIFFLLITGFFLYIIIRYFTRVKQRLDYLDLLQKEHLALKEQKARIELTSSKNYDEIESLKEHIGALKERNKSSELRVEEFKRKEYLSSEKERINGITDSDLLDNEWDKLYDNKNLVKDERSALSNQIHDRVNALRVKANEIPFGDRVYQKRNFVIVERIFWRIERTEGTGQDYKIRLVRNLGQGKENICISDIQKIDGGKEYAIRDVLLELHKKFIKPEGTVDIEAMDEYNRQLFEELSKEQDEEWSELLGPILEDSGDERIIDDYDLPDFPD